MGFVAPPRPVLPFAHGQPTATSEANRGDADTEDLPPTEIERPASPPLPFAPAAVPTLTLQQYASLCAELHVFSDRAEAIFHQYGLGSPGDRTSVDLAWRERLRRNPAEHQGWQALYQRWVEYFEQKKAGSGAAG